VPHKRSPRRPFAIISDLPIRSRPWLSTLDPLSVSAIAFTLIVGLVPARSYPAGTEGAASPEARALIDLVHQYLGTDDADQASQRLSEILRRPEAQADRLMEIIKAGPRYGPAPVGVQPSVPVRVKDRTYRYGLYVPSSYQPTTEYPLVICLHGAGFTGDAYLERWQTRLGERYILACPTLMQGTWWTRRAEELVLATIQDVQARYRVDPNRIFLTGMSNGGVGALVIGVHQGALFAGLAPMAGGLDDVLLPFLGNLRNTPAYLIHGKQDHVMPVELSRTVSKELDRLGYAYVYREHDRVHPFAGGHYFPREELPELVAWLDARRRDPYPPHVTVVRDASHLGSFGWVRIDATDRIAALSQSLTDSQDELVAQRVYAKLDASVTRPNRIEVTTNRVRRFTLFLNRELVDVSRPLTVVTNGQESFRGILTSSAETLLRDARHRRDRGMLFSTSVTVSVPEEP